MSVFNLSDSGVTKLFNEYVIGGVSDQVVEDTTLYGRFKTNTRDCKGKYALFKNLTQTPTSARPSSSSTLPTAQQGTYDEFKLYMKRGMYAQLQFDGLATACAQGKGAVVDVLEQEIHAITMYMSNRLNKQFWGDGSGRLAQLEAASSASTTVQIDGPLFGQDSNERTDPGQYLVEGQYVDIYDGSGNLEVEEVAISSLADDADGTGTLTMAEAVTASNNGYIFDHDTYASSEAAGTGVPMGIHGIVNSSDPYVGITQVSFQGVDRDTYSYAQANEINHSSAAITNANMLKLVHQCAKWGGKTSVMLTNEIIWRSYYQILEADKTMPDTKVFWGGLQGLAFYGGRQGKIPIIFDYDCPDNNLYAIDERYINVYAPVKNGLTWLPGDKGPLKRVSGKDEWVASLVYYYNMGTPKPRAHGRLYNIKHAAS
jgi:hypothetical protein